MSEAKDHGRTIFIIDDDESIRDSLALMLGLLGYRTATFANAEVFLDAYQDNWRGCVIADLKMPGRSGLELHEELRARGTHLPFVIFTAHGGVTSARIAFNAGVLDFIEKPSDEADLLAAIEKGMATELGRVHSTATKRDDEVKFAMLTDRERELLKLAANGLHAKEIALALGISPRTAEVQKACVMGKIGARNVSELVRFAVSAK